MVEGAAYRRAQIFHLADVVEADVPLVAGAVEGMAEASGHIVAFEHQNSPASVAGEEDSGGKSTYAGADNDRIPAFLQLDLLKRDAHA